MSRLAMLRSSLVSSSSRLRSAVGVSSGDMPASTRLLRRMLGRQDWKIYFGRGHEVDEEMDHHQKEEEMMDEEVVTIAGCSPRPADQDKPLRTRPHKECRQTCREAGVVGEGIGDRNCEKMYGRDWLSLRPDLQTQKRVLWRGRVLWAGPRFFRSSCRRRSSPLAAAEQSFGGGGGVSRPLVASSGGGGSGTPRNSVSPHRESEFSASENYIL